MTEPLTICTFLWKPNGTWSRRYEAKHVNAWARMITANLHIPHRLVCVTDDPTGIEIPTVPLWPMPIIQVAPNKPNCYKRLYAFSKNVKCWFGSRFAQIDLDCLIRPGPDGKGITPLLDHTDDFRILHGIRNGRGCCPYNGSIWQMDTGARDHVWTSFDPKKSPDLSHKNTLPSGKKYYGSDQAWIAHCLPNEKTWDRGDGICSYVRDMGPADKIPDDCRIMFFAGAEKPWTDLVKQFHPSIWNEYSKYL
jgi:hypothetical protein